MKDSLHLSIDFDCIIGCREKERTNHQPINVDITIYTDLSRSGKTDVLTDTIDTEMLYDIVASIVDSLQPKLMEHLCATIIDALFETNSIDRAVVCVTKKQPPIGSSGKVTATACMDRSRNNR